MTLDICIVCSMEITLRLEMLVVSPKFRGMKLLQQHRLMNKV